jgi:lipopolysaccharide kinase (Kdo/WaaP) family protein
MSTDLPDKFERMTGKGYRAVVRSSAKDALLAQGALAKATFEELRTTGTPAGRGRSIAGTIDLDGVGRVVLRRGQRGGALGGLLGGLYLCGERPVEELAVAEWARAAGAPVPEYVAAVVWPAWPFYSAGLIVREVPDSVTLQDWLRGRNTDEAGAMAGPLADAFARLFAAGVYHADLHAGNVLVQEADGQLELHIIDFDKSVRHTPLPSALRDLMLFRFNRALVKRGLSPDPVEPALRLRLCRELGLEGDELKRFVTGCEAHLERHKGRYGSS